MFNLTRTDKTALTAIRERLNAKTKPPGSLGMLEQVAEQLSLILGMEHPALHHPTVVIFAADHGLATSGVSAYPQEVTRQMVLNFVRGGAAINVFARQHGLHLRIVNAGVIGEPFDTHAGVIDAKIADGTQNMLHSPAMSRQQLDACIAFGRQIVTDIHSTGCNLFIPGEMGIGNTSSASIIMHMITGVHLADCVGAGTGMFGKKLLKKTQILENVIAKHGKPSTPWGVLETYGGFELAMITASILEAASRKMVILVDGFIVSCAVLLAHALHPEVLDYCLFAHRSSEQAHKQVLDYLDVKALLIMNLRLGEASGAALAYPLLQSALHMYNEMHTFADAGVSKAHD